MFDVSGFDENKPFNYQSGHRGFPSLSDSATWSEENWDWRQCQKVIGDHVGCHYDMFDASKFWWI
jgi:hypothetical protein